MFFFFCSVRLPLFKRPESRREAEPALPTSFKVLFVLLQKLIKGSSTPYEFLVFVIQLESVDPEEIY